MSQQDIQTKQDVQKSGVLLVEQKSSRSRQDNEQNPTKQDVQGNQTNKTDLQKSVGSNFSKVDVKKKHSKSKSSRRDFSIKLSRDKSGSIIVNKENSPETIPMSPQDVPQKKASVIPALLSKTTPAQPIPSTLDDVKSYHGLPAQGQAGEEQPDPDDSTTDHIAELRTKPKYSDWSDEEEAGGLPRSESRSSRVSRAVRQFFCCGLRCEAPDEDKVPRRTSNLKQVSSCTIKKKELTWDDDEYLNKVILKSMGETSRALSLERKASVGPFRSAKQFERASGLTICVPKKSTRNICGNNTDAGINISISKKNLTKSKSALDVDFDIKNRGDVAKQEEKRAVKVDIEVPYMKIFKVVRSKLGFVRNKFQTVRNYTSS